MPRTFTTAQVVRRTGASFRRIDYWDRTGIVTPSAQPADGSGSLRLYSQVDLWRAAVVTQLLDAGLSLTAVREVLDQVAQHGEARRGHVTVKLDLEALATKLALDPPPLLQLVAQ